MSSGPAGLMGESGVVDPKFAEQENALRNRAGGHLRQLDVVTVVGPDAASFLEGQVSQAVASMAPGQGKWSFVLHPQGKVVALVRVLRDSEESFSVFADGDTGPAVAERLERFRLRVKAEIEARTVKVLSLRGPDLPADATNGVPSLWPSWPGVDIIEADTLPEGVMACGPEAWDAARVAVGVPMNGRELTDKTIPAESGMVDLAADFTKGCYVGQELVARIDSRGHVNRHLRRLSVLSGPLPDPGTELVAPESDKPMGTITSAAPSALDRPGVALAYVRREISPGEELRTRDGLSEVRIAI